MKFKYAVVMLLGFASLVSCSDDSEPVPLSHRVHVEGIGFDYARSVNYPAEIYVFVSSSGASFTGYFLGTFDTICVNGKGCNELYDLWPWTGDHNTLKCEWGEMWYEKEEDKDGFTVSHITIYPNNDTKPRQLSFSWGFDPYYTLRVYQDGQNPRSPYNPEQPDGGSN